MGDLSDRMCDQEGITSGRGPFSDPLPWKPVPKASCLLCGERKWRYMGCYAVSGPPARCENGWECLECFRKHFEADTPVTPLPKTKLI